MLADEPEKRVTVTGLCSSCALRHLFASCFLSANSVPFLRDFGAIFGYYYSVCAHVPCMAHDAIPGHRGGDLGALRGVAGGGSWGRHRQRGGADDARSRHSAGSRCSKEKGDRAAPQVPEVAPPSPQCSHCPRPLPKRRTGCSSSRLSATGDSGKWWVGGMFCSREC